VQVVCFNGRDCIAGVNFDPAIGDRSMPSRHALAIGPSARSSASLAKTTFVIGSMSRGSNKIRAAISMSDALRAKMPIVSSVGARGIAPTAGTTP
jgi:hypothetical protein